MMFKQSEIGAKCSCGVPETVCKEDYGKRYRLPAGTYGRWYEQSHYYAAIWMTLECQQCLNRREDFIVYRWGSNGDLWPIDSAFRKDEDRQYPDVYKAVRQLLPK